MKSSRFSRVLCLMVGLVGVTAPASAAVDAGAIPRAEHPRPDARRAEWLSLNGAWQFAIDTRGEGDAGGWSHGHDLPLTIAVPFPPQSKLSGLARIGDYTEMWYRRMFAVPAAMSGGRVRLHFGAVDYRAEVYVNGVDVGGHTGGSAAFAFDITPFLRAGENELVVRVHDDLRDGTQPKGKQALKSEGCFYTATSGIWQSVWLEAVGRTFIRQPAITTDIDAGTATVAVDLGGDDNPALTLRAEARIDGRVVGQAATPLTGRHGRVTIPLAEKHLWAPGHPFLYDLVLTLVDGERTVDRLESYFGLRSVSISGRRILINGRPVFQRLILDQGFYPDGIWTAPSDAALKQDIERSMAAGFNGARLHQKVFEPRFLYWADKLGYLVWGEFPNWGMDYGPPSHAPFVSEWIEVMRRDRNHPAVIGWCPFNETGHDAGPLQQVIWNVTRALDPTRPVIESSGWTHTLPHPEVLDSHDYDQNPATFRQRWLDFFARSATRLAPPPRYGWGPLAVKDQGVPFMISEYGGIGWTTDTGWGYGAGPRTLEEFYTRYQGLTDALLDNPNLFGFCYTQLTDVEQERNGLYTYDRRPKFDVARLHAITSRQAAFERDEPAVPAPAPSGLDRWRIVVGGDPDGVANAPYRISEDTPIPGWNRPDFDDAAWTSGRLPLGITEWRHPATPWKTGGRLLRRHFAGPSETVAQAGLVLVSTSAVEVYLNGESLLARGPTMESEMSDVTERFNALIRPGDNVIAIRLAPGETAEPFFNGALLVR